jgi:regulator of sigma E protease
MAKKMGVKVEIFSIGFGPKIWSIKRGDTLYAVSAIPLGGYIKMAGEEPGEEKTGADWEFYSKPIYKRFNIVVAGSVFNYILGFILFSMIFMIGAPVPTSRIGRILEGYPAERAGLKENDKIIEIDGKEVKYWEEVLDIIHNKGKDDITRLAVDRDGDLLRFALSGRSEEQKDMFGKPVKTTMIGIAPSDEVDYVRHGIVKSISMGGRTLWNITTLSYRVIWGLLTGSVPVNMVGGPIMIAAVTGKAAKMGITHVIWISALISASLAIINLLPFPVLDGGHVLFLAIEKIKGRPVDKKVQEVVQQVAIVLLIAFFLLISWNDILNFPKYLK